MADEASVSFQVGGMEGHVTAGGRKPRRHDEDEDVITVEVELEVEVEGAKIESAPVCPLRTNFRTNAS